MTDNAQRAEWAQIAAMSFARQTEQDWKEDKEQVIADLLTDIVHLCDRDSVSFRQVYVNAMLRYQADADMPLPVAIKDLDDDSTVEHLPSEEAAWLRLQEMPEAETGRFQIETDVRK